MIQLFITGVRVGLITATITAVLSMITFSQTTKPAIESTPAAIREEVASDSLKYNKKSAERDTSVQTDSPNDPAISVAVKVEIQRHVNELRREQLDDHEKYIDYWLSAVAIVLAFFGIVVVVAGYIGFRRFREIETEAKGYVEEIKKHRDESSEIIQSLNAKTVADNPEEAKQVVANVGENPTASPIDRAVAQAVSLQQQGKRDEAIEKWRAVAHVAEEGDSEQAARAWFSVGYLLENPEDSIAAYNRAIDLDPDDADAYNNRGVVKGELGQYEDAISDCDEAIRLKPDNANAYTNRGNAKIGLGYYEDAISDYDKAIRQQPDNAGAYYNRGNAKSELGRYEDTIADYDEAIRLQPDNAGAYYNRGNAKSELGYYEDTIADYDEAIRLQPDNANAYTNRGVAKGELGEYADAISDYDEAIRLKSDFAEAYNNRGRAKAKLGQHSEAISDCDKAIRLNPDLAEAYYNRGIAKGELGLIDEARQDFEKARDLAREAGNDSLADAVEQRLRDLAR